MLIMNQTRDALLNLDNATSIELTITGDGTFNEIWAEVIDGAPVTLGEYITEERAKEVLKKIADIQGGASTYYMPEE